MQIRGPSEIPIAAILMCPLIFSFSLWLSPSARGQVQDLPSQTQRVSAQQLANKIRDLKTEVDNTNSRITELEAVVGTLTTKRSELSMDHEQLTAIKTKLDESGWKALDATTKLSNLQGVGQKHGGIKFIDDFVPVLKQHEEMNNKLKAEMLDSERMQRARSKSEARRS